MSPEPFDIFEFLGISQGEPVVHTPMLAGLLDPFGAHGMGTRFLGEFLAVLSSDDLLLSAEDAHRHAWIIKQEHSVPGGRIDLLLLCPDKGVGIAIENKVESKESASQLPCY